MLTVAVTFVASANGLISVKIAVNKPVTCRLILLVITISYLSLEVVSFAELEVEVVLVVVGLDRARFQLVEVFLALAQWPVGYHWLVVLCLLPLASHFFALAR